MTMPNQPKTQLVTNHAAAVSKTDDVIWIFVTFVVEILPMIVPKLFCRFCLCFRRRENVGKVVVVV